MTNVKSLHVLVLGALDDEPIDHWVGPDAHLEHAATLESALAALRCGSFDLVISRAQDFLACQGVHVAGQAAIIDSVPQGICIVDDKGRLEWANPKMLTIGPEIRDRVTQFCRELFQRAAGDAEHAEEQIRARRFTFATRDNEFYEISATPVIDLHERVTHVAAFVRNATSTRRLQEKIDAIDRAGRELLSLDVEQLTRLDPQERLALLEQKIIRCTRELLHFDNFEVRVLNRKTNQLELVLAHGIPPQQQHVDLCAVPEGNGICGYVAARGKSYICPDTTTDPRYLPCIEGARSSLTVPLFLHDEVVGVANFESTRPGAFDEDARQFAEIFSRYVALALHLLELLINERQATTGQVGSNVMAEITSPLNDILTDVESLVEDYLGHDDLRHRLRAISENAVRIRESIKELTSPRSGCIGARAARKKLHDPVLFGKRILIAEDEDMIRDTVSDVLTGYGCEVSAVCDGLKAVELLAEKQFDLVLSDIKMPQRNGYQVFAAAKEANPQTPVILTTGFGYDPNHSIVRARREGLSAVLFKPFKIDQLLTELRMALTPAR